MKTEICTSLKLQRFQAMRANIFKNLILTTCLLSSCLLSSCEKRSVPEPNKPNTSASLSQDYVPMDGSGGRACLDWYYLQDMKYIGTTGYCGDPANSLPSRWTPPVGAISASSGGGGSGGTGGMGDSGDYYDGYAAAELTTFTPRDGGNYGKTLRTRNNTYSTIETRVELNTTLHTLTKLSIVLSGVTKFTSLVQVGDGVLVSYDRFSDRYYFNCGRWSKSR